MSVSRDPTSIAYNADLVDIIGRVVELKRVGNYLMGCCPFHDDRTLSMSVMELDGHGVDTFFCFGCGARGDAIEFVKRYYRMTFIEALESLGGEPSTPVHDLPKKPVSKADKSKWVHRIWENTFPLFRGDTGGSYLANRGIDVDDLGNLPNLACAYLQYRGDGEEHFTLVAAVRDEADELIGLQRTYLAEGGTKLSVKEPKLSLGTLRGGAIKLGEGEQEIVICEGLEDGLSLRLAFPETAVWVAAGGCMMSHMPIPDECQTLIIAQDNDDAGEIAAKAAIAAFRRPWRDIRIMKPSPEFKDFNDELVRSAVA